MRFNGRDLSSYTYVCTKLRDNPALKGSWLPLLIRKPAVCNHGSGDYPNGVLASICTTCAEWWSWDYDLCFSRTEGGRRLARMMGLDPADAGQVLRYRDGYGKK